MWNDREEYTTVLRYVGDPNLERVVVRGGGEGRGRREKRNWEGHPPLS